MRKLLILLLLSMPALAAEHPGSEEFVQRATTEFGLEEAGVRELLASAEYQQSIVDAISRPAEGKPWHEYRKIFLTDTRIRQGIEFWSEHRDLIARASKEFGVDEEIIDHQFTS